MTQIYLTNRKSTFESVELTTKHFLLHNLQTKMCWLIQLGMTWGEFDATKDK
jgi:membrane-associated PAP2 superfamily phosphatase